jgi:hypothetical protein
MVKRGGFGTDRGARPCMKLLGAYTQAIIFLKKSHIQQKHPSKLKKCLLITLEQLEI